MDVRVHIGRSAGRSIPPDTDIYCQEWQIHISTVRVHIGRFTPPKNNNNCNVSWDIYYEMYLAAIMDSARKGGNFFLFLNN